MKRKFYTKEFKKEAVKLALQSEQSLNATAKELGVSQSGLRKWIKEQKGQEPLAADRNIEKQFRELEKENRRLRMEREILKKAAAFFAKENQ